jgi:hypothetical protein
MPFFNSPAHFNRSAIGRHFQRPLVQVRYLTRSGVSMGRTCRLRELTGLRGGGGDLRSSRPSWRPAERRQVAEVVLTGSSWSIALGDLCSSCGASRAAKWEHAFTLIS